MKVTLSLKDESLKTPDMPDDPGWFKKKHIFFPQKISQISSFRPSTTVFLVFH
jgi:hypothetical protein